MTVRRLVLHELRGTSPSRRGEDLTVAAWIRHQRLERARRYLTDLTMRHETIDELAA
ncbi:hypothetical protein Sgleb_02680 [Streptomyces glebosus]|uniref:Uncharacterized protein n=1 Tax=Streptomyces glebosus TaxID=249580 RepID=A0A640SPG3_9ACTN|nr:hypothetical protein Sgleb_02680 [Streptomyces glebosus]